MRWRKKRKPPAGDQRVRSGFLLFPRTLRMQFGDREETRWLERAAWMERYIYDEQLDYSYWEALHWVSLGDV